MQTLEAVADGVVEKPQRSYPSLAEPPRPDLHGWRLRWTALRLDAAHQRARELCDDEPLALPVPPAARVRRPAAARRPRRSTRAPAAREGSPDGLGTSRGSSSRRRRDGARRRRCSEPPCAGWFAPVVRARLMRPRGSRTRVPRATDDIAKQCPRGRAGRVGRRNERERRRCWSRKRPSQLPGSSEPCGCSCGSSALPLRAGCRTGDPLGQAFGQLGGAAKTSL